MHRLHSKTLLCASLPCPHSLAVAAPGPLTCSPPPPRTSSRWKSETLPAARVLIDPPRPPHRFPSPHCRVLPSFSYFTSSQIFRQAARLPGLPLTQVPHAGPAPSAPTNVRAARFLTFLPSVPCACACLSPANVPVTPASFSTTKTTSSSSSAPPSAKGLLAGPSGRLGPA